MKLFHWASSHGNFGDDMNLFLWEHFLPGVFDGNDDAMFIGIGTILSADIPKARHRIVMGSGTGYGRLPADLDDDSWRIYAVRGPLTARAINADPKLAVADPAILLPLLPEFAPASRRGVAFVPHWTTAKGGIWQTACARAGFDFIDPRHEAKRVIRQIAAAQLVIAESMHGAIVADAFRVPWIAVVSGRDTPLKWHDWALALAMEYRPYEVGQLSVIPMVRDGRREVSSVRAEMSAQEYASSVDAAVSSFVQRSSRPAAVVRPGARARVKAGICRLLDRAGHSMLADRGARMLTQISKLPPRLSADGVLRDRQAELVRRIESFREDLSAGAFSASRPLDPPGRAMNPATPQVLQNGR
ncbi:polysaccharide pyruvyl transferase family protein [Aromatoleum bremense]|uniref:Polysaccharide pyruvyl transferase family protein n=1 Tax=Aromatoleum bremense TaxID=76115 RepID=A0ABX1NQE9_9RHOO|nr:polysaccharide pyruvyl transferase family protein [Aromatoleum bremense]NMG14123.1 polysaccharide pyruvyl transferase family protein [Aromatoleum bremense]QTQ33900.1 Putative pyruvyl transferase [Aromatoleum bremense]